MNGPWQGGIPLRLAATRKKIVASVPRATESREPRLEDEAMRLGVWVVRKPLFECYGLAKSVEHVQKRSWPLERRKLRTEIHRLHAFSKMRHRLATAGKITTRT